MIRFSKEGFETWFSQGGKNNRKPSPNHTVNLSESCPMFPKSRPRREKIRRRSRKSTHPLKPANLKSTRQRELSNAALRFPGYSVRGYSEFSSCEWHHVEGCRTTAYLISFLLDGTSPVNSNTPRPPARPILQGTRIFNISTEAVGYLQ